MSADPIWEQYLGTNPKDLVNDGMFDTVHMNLYSYVRQNPINLYDPDGLTEYKAQFEAVAVYFGGGKIGLAGSYDDESKEVGLYFVIGPRVGGDFSLSASGDKSESSGKPAENNLKGRVKFNGEVAGGPVGLEYVLAERNIDEGVVTDANPNPTGVNLGTDVVADKKGKLKPKVKGGVGASIGADISMGGTTDLFYKASTAIQEYREELDKIEIDLSDALQKKNDK